MSTQLDPAMLQANALIESNIGLSLLGLAHYDEAETCFHHFIASVAAETWQHVDALIEAKCGLAEVYLKQSDFSRAWESVNDALRLATERQHQVVLAEINFTRAHIAEVDPSPPQPPETYYQLGKEALYAQTSKRNVARTLMTEARYQQRHGHQERTKLLAEEAHAFYQELDMKEASAQAAALASPSAHFPSGEAPEPS